MTLYRFADYTPKTPDNGDYWVAPDANVIGWVTIGAGVGIWFGVTIRGDNEPIIIGDGTNIQENTIMHTDIGFPLSIGENCTIGHKAMLHGCEIGNNSLIGMGATILNGAKIGANCLIGAGALVTEGKVIPDGSLVMGTPGKVVRQLDQAAIDKLELSARHYQDNMRRFKSDLEILNP
jgi:carbonic anhydrase/acetyltransferase-like protein (isoleucine patch superfamily)